MDQLPVKQPWEKRESETDTAYHRFTLYLELGPDRSISQVAEGLQKGDGYATFLRRWSAEHDWVTRAGEYDRYMIRQAIKNRNKQIDYAHGRMIQRIDDALNTIFDIMMMDDYTDAVGKSSNVSNKLKAAFGVLDRIGVVAPQPEDVKNAKDVPPMYVQILNHFNTIQNNGLNGPK